MNTDQRLNIFYIPKTKTFSVISKRADTQRSDKSAIQPPKERSQISSISLCSVLAQFCKSGKLARTEQVKTRGRHRTPDFLSKVLKLLVRSFVLRALLNLSYSFILHEYIHKLLCLLHLILFSYLQTYSFSEACVQSPQKMLLYGIHPSRAFLHQLTILVIVSFVKYLDCCKIAINLCGN